MKNYQFNNQIDTSQSLASLFKNTRVSRGISLEEAANATKIRKSILVEIENNNYEHISSEIHIKNFITSYARFLGINEEKALALYRRDKGLSQNSLSTNSKSTITNNQIYKIIKQVINTKALVTLIILAFITAIIYFFYKVWSIANTPPDIVILTPQNKQVIKEENFIIEGITNGPHIKVYVDGNEASYIEPIGKFRAYAKFTQPGLKRFVIVAQNELQKKSEYYLDLIYEPPEKIIQPKLITPQIEIQNKTNKPQTIKVKKADEITRENITQEISLQPLATQNIEILPNNQFIIEGIDTSFLNIKIIDKDNNQHQVLEIKNQKIYTKLLGNNILIVEIK